MLNSAIWLIDRNQSGATTSGQNEPGSNGSEVVLRIPKISSITEASPSIGLVSYQNTRWGKAYQIS